MKFQVASQIKYWSPPVGGSVAFCSPDTFVISYISLCLELHFTY